MNQYCTHQYEVKIHMVGVFSELNILGVARCVPGPREVTDVEVGNARDGTAMAITSLRATELVTSGETGEERDDACDENELHGEGPFLLGAW